MPSSGLKAVKRVQLGVQADMLRCDCVHDEAVDPCSDWNDKRSTYHHLRVPGFQHIIMVIIMIITIWARLVPASAVEGFQGSQGCEVSCPVRPGMMGK